MNAAAAEAAPPVVGAVAQEPGSEPEGEPSAAPQAVVMTPAQQQNDVEMDEQELAAEEPVAEAEDGEGLGTPRPEFGLRFRWS